MQDEVEAIAIDRNIFDVDIDEMVDVYSDIEKWDDIKNKKDIEELTTIIFGIYKEVMSLYENMEEIEDKVKNQHLRLNQIISDHLLLFEKIIRFTVND